MIPPVTAPARMTGLYPATVLAAVFLCGCGRKEAPRTTEAGADVVKQLVASEELILALQQRMASLDAALLTKSFPGGEPRGTVFAPEVLLTDLTTNPDGKPGPLSTLSFTWTGAESKKVSGSDWTMWQVVLDSITRMERASWVVVDGHFTATDTFETVLSLDGMAWRDAKPVAVSASAHAVWRKLTEGPLAWRIAGWRTERVTLTEAPAPFFSEVFDRISIEPAAAKSRVRHSLHYETVMRGYFGGGIP